MENVSLKLDVISEACDGAEDIERPMPLYECIAEQVTSIVLEMRRAVGHSVDQYSDGCPVRLARSRRKFGWAGSWPKEVWGTVWVGVSVLARGGVYYIGRCIDSPTL